MRLRLIAVVALVAACSSSNSSSSSGSTTSSGPSGSGPSGTIATKAFASASAVFNVGKGGAIDLLVSDKPGLCDALKAGHIRAGETVVQLYNLTGTAPGTFTSGAATEADIKYVTIKTSCASGHRVDETVVDAAGRATTPSIDVTTSTSTSFAGSLNLAFDDGSKLAGSFEAVPCETTVAETVTCE